MTPEQIAAIKARAEKPEPVSAWALVNGSNNVILDAGFIKSRMDHISWNQNKWLEANGSAYRTRVIPVTITAKDE